MSCNHPRLAFDTGLLTDKGKKRLFMLLKSNFKEDATISVDFVESKIHDKILDYSWKDGERVLDKPVAIPCGHCIGCVTDYKRQWVDRISCEALYFPEALKYFVTITYDDAHLPEGLVKKDLQDFIKRLRFHNDKIVNPLKLKYFACGERGDNSNRPHYHAIFLGLKLDDLRQIGLNNWTSDFLTSLWGKGFVMVQPVEPGSIAYVVGYVEKKLEKRNLGLCPDEFNLMSKGLGKRYFDEFEQDIYFSDKIRVDGNNRPVPPYFDKLHFGKPEYKSMEPSLRSVRKARGDSLTRTESKKYSVKDEALGFYKDSMMKAKRRSKSKL